MKHAPIHRHPEIRWGTPCASLSLVLALAGLCGCESTPPKTASDSRTTPPTVEMPATLRAINSVQAWMDDATEPPTPYAPASLEVRDPEPERLARDIDYDGLRASAESRRAEGRNEARRAVPAIGLYGEFDGEDEGDGGSFTPMDGSTNVRPVTAATEGACWDPDLHPSGTVLAFTSTMHRETSDIYLKSTTGSTNTQLTSDPANDMMPAISPDGSRVAFTSDRAGNWDIYIVPTAGGRPVEITSDADHELHPSWSPDGEQLVYCRLNSRSGRWELWSVDVNNASVKRFLTYGMFPKWSPDIASNKILFQRARERDSRRHSIWTIDYVDGEAKSPTEIVSAANAATINPTWSPDGSRIAFVTVVDPEAQGETARPQRSDVWIVNVDGTGRLNVTNGRYANYEPVWSPDGQLYFVSNRSGVDNIWAADLARTPLPVMDDDRGVATVDPARAAGR